MSYYRAENILPPKRLQAVKEYVCSISDKFEEANVIPPMPGFRVANVLYGPVLPQGVTLILEKHIELAAIALSMAVHRALEIQITRTPNGGYFRRHTDNTVTKGRGLSYAFYFGNPVMGGELFLDLPSGGVTIDPCDNSIVVFPADVPHEVLPVVCGDAFIEGRFTINGWIGKI